MPKNQIPDDLQMVLATGLAIVVKHLSQRVGETPLEAINKAMDSLEFECAMDPSSVKSDRITQATVEVSNAFLEAMGTDARIGDSAKLGKKRWLSRGVNNGFGKK